MNELVLVIFTLAVLVLSFSSGSYTDRAKPTNDCAEVVACLRPLEEIMFPLAATDYSPDIEKLCKSMHIVVTCLEDAGNNCPLIGLEETKKEFNTMLSMCGMENKKVGCSREEILDCINPLVNLSPSQDLALMCLDVHRSVDCFQDEVEKCPSEMKVHFEHSNTQLEKLRAACNPFIETTTKEITTSPGQEGDKGDKPDSIRPSLNRCSWRDIERCVWPLQKILPGSSTEHKLKLCMNYDSAMHCLKREVSLCPNYAPAQMWQLQVTIDQAHHVCKNVRLKPAILPNVTNQPLRSSCVNEQLSLRKCLIHSQLDPVRRKTLGQKEICWMVGRSDICLSRHVDNIACTYGTVTRLAQQLETQKAACKQMGFPTIKGMAIQQNCSVTLLSAVFVTMLWITNCLH